tara:strand:- start:4227 stop:5591 length:1365 start_codon:yes stop_codon:yes gene_type:complete
VNGYKIIDQRVDNQWRNTLINELKNRQVLYVALSSMTGNQIKGTLEAARIVKKVSKEILIVMGGVHVSFLPTQTLNHPLIDVVVIGEGEITLQELTKSLDGDKRLDQIDGIGYKTKDNEIKINKSRSLIDISNAMNIPYNLVDIKNYFVDLYGGRKTLSLQTGRGCPHRCTYCYNLIYNKKKWRSISSEDIIRKIKTLKGYGAQTIDLVDDNFFTNIKRVEELVIMLEKEDLKMKFMTNCRIDYLVRMDISFLKRLNKVGFNEVFLGIESGSQRILDFIKKDITVEQIIEANKKLKESKIKAVYAFMAGFPDEKISDVQKTINMMINLKKDNPICSVTSIKAYMPFPGTELFDIATKKGFKHPKSLEEWSIFNFNYTEYGFNSKKMTKLIEKLSYLTYFLDKETMVQNFGGNFLLNILIRIYCDLVLLRCKLGFYHLSPELYIMRKLREKLFGD